MDDNSLAHYGVMGMKWGVRKDGKPQGYQGSGKASKSAANVAKATPASSSSPTGKRGLSDKQKTALKIGAGVLATAALAYGGYKVGAINPDIVNAGKQWVKVSAQARMWQLKESVPAVRKLDEKRREAKYDRDMAAWRKEFEREHQARMEERLASGVQVKTYLSDGRAVRKTPLTETHEESLKKVNPNRGDASQRNNCTSCGVAGALRTAFTTDARAKSTGGAQKNLAGIVEECFDLKTPVMEGSAVKFGKSVPDAAEMLHKRFGEGASGVVSVKWKGTGGGHTFNWQTYSSGVVLFSDYQTGSSGGSLDKYWDMIDPNANLQVIRLDDATPNWDALSEYVDFD